MKSVYFSATRDSKMELSDGGWREVALEAGLESLPEHLLVRDGPPILLKDGPNAMDQRAHFHVRRDESVATIC